MAATPSTLVDLSTLGPVRERLRRLDALHRECVAAMGEYLHLFQGVGPGPEVDAAEVRMNELRARLLNCEAIALSVLRAAHGKGGKTAARSPEGTRSKAGTTRRRVEGAAGRGSTKAEAVKDLGLSPKHGVEVLAPRVTCPRHYRLVQQPGDAPGHEPPKRISQRRHPTPQLPRGLAPHGRGLDPLRLQPRHA